MSYTVGVTAYDAKTDILTIEVGGQVNGRDVCEDGALYGEEMSATEFNYWATYRGDSLFGKCASEILKHGVMLDLPGKLHTIE